MSYFSNDVGNLYSLNKKKILNSHGDCVRMCTLLYEYLCDEMKCKKKKNRISIVKRAMLCIEKIEVEFMTCSTLPSSNLNGFFDFMQLYGAMSWVILAAMNRADSLFARRSPLTRLHKKFRLRQKVSRHRTAYFHRLDCHTGLRRSHTQRCSGIYWNVSRYHFSSIQFQRKISRFWGIDSAA